MMFPCWPSLTLNTFPLEACILMSLLGQLLHLRCLLFLWRSLFSTGLLIRFRVERYFKHFKGEFKDEHFDCPRPPKRVFNNHSSCIPFTQFISDTILQRLSSGDISVFGRVDEVPPPYLVMPLTVEPSKPRLCNDNRFLNLWMVDKPFTLDHLSDLQLCVERDSFQTVCDDKLGYDRIMLSPDSRTFLGFEWGGWYFTSNTIPFGWKLSAFTDLPQHRTSCFTLLSIHWYTVLALY